MVFFGRSGQIITSNWTKSNEKLSNPVYILSNENQKLSNRVSIHAGSQPASLSFFMSHKRRFVQNNNCARCACGLM